MVQIDVLGRCGPSSVILETSAERKSRRGLTIMPGWVTEGYEPRSRTLVTPEIFTKGGWESTSAT
jgi:hypothetical protein